MTTIRLMRNLFSLLLAGAVLTGCSTPCCLQKSSGKDPCGAVEDGQLEVWLRELDRNRFTHEGPGAAAGRTVRHTVFRLNTEEAFKTPLLLLHEMPGLSPECVRLADTLAREFDFAVYVPLMFGRPGAEGFCNDVRWALVHGLGWHREWRKNAAGRRDISEWLKSLSRTISDRHHGQPIGAVGMCMSGNLPLALLEEESVGSVVLSQPSLPIQFIRTERGKRSLDISTAELTRAKERSRKETLNILVFRFENDLYAAGEKIGTLREHFEERLVYDPIPCEDYAAHGIRDSAHAVLTREYCPEDEHPTRRRLLRLVAHFRRELPRHP